ncbi:glycosyltransferase family 4 protein [Candidatus Aciduliprofundum boonei]|uniref:Glycosyl transferase group 1 n=1 Tax=Aciduliprofundum boonei (strain DSM 19572 / T469) TaxID=439481 RepID=B5IDL3_ACIB4|nr:glycosyltransferase family 4 protein [Candidatus Aciduliprofundum boonei]ADD08087.1 glycosyl transferase group 1 [Aciduliprofundum boonei T469]EDY35673.1 glycosyl transferase, group 1 family protein [Aciduliprofundum boonei T469]HII55539.1 glycosyltransferase family 4 protein [Candidatus Aciduliprofundum boonei]
MKILFSGHSIEHYNLGLVNALSKMLNVYIVHNRHIDIQTRQIIIPRIRRSDIPRNLSLIILSKIFDIVHINNAQQSAFLKSDDKLIITEHGCPSTKGLSGSTYKFYNKEIERLIEAYEKGVKIITISKYSAEKLREELGVKVYAYIYHGLIESFRTQKFKELKNETTPLILWVSRFVKAKEPFVFLKSLKLLATKIDFKAYMIGNGPLQRNIQHFISKYELNKNIFIINSIPFKEMPSIYNSASLFIHTNRQEHFGFSILEAMGMGLPVIVPNSGGAQEIANDAGITFEPGDHKDLAEKILEILTDPERYYKYSRKSIERAKFFSWEKAAKEYLEVYKKVGG